MSAPENHLALSLERLAEVHGDPTAAVYERLFATHPELESFFVLDRKGLVRGSMLANVFESLLDISGDRRHGLNLILAERLTHDGMGVSHAMFAQFFDVVFETVRDLLGDAWTPDMERAWRAALAEIHAATV